jgi:ATP-dependent DNA helicase RecG
MLAHRFGEVGNADIQPYRREHPRDIGTKLKLLVDRKWLGKHGHGRGTRYRWRQLDAPDLFGGTLEMERAALALNDFPPKSSSSQHKEGGSQHKLGDSPDYEALRELATPIRERQRAKPVDVRAAILSLCSGRYLSLRELAQLLGRQPASVQNHYLTPMLKEGVLVQRYPGNPNHPNQGYRKAEG